MRLTQFAPLIRSESLNFFIIYICISLNPFRFLRRGFPLLDVLYCSNYDSSSKCSVICTGHKVVVVFYELETVLMAIWY